MWRKSGNTCIEYRHFVSIIIYFSIPILSKKSFVLRITIQTYAALEKWSSDEFRSVNGQLEMLIDKALRESGRKKELAGNILISKSINKS